MIDGVPVNDAFGGVSAVSNLEVEAVQDLEVITAHLMLNTVMLWAVLLMQ